MKKIFLLFLLLLVGCTSTPGIIDTGNGVYSSTISGQRGYVNIGEMRANAYISAKEHCKNSNQIPKESFFGANYGLFKFPEAELRFHCVDGDAIFKK